MKAADADGGNSVEYTITMKGKKAESECNLSPGVERLHSDVDQIGVVAPNPLVVILKLLQTPSPKQGRGQVGSLTGGCRYGIIHSVLKP